MKVTNILMVGCKLNTKGGITTVIKKFLDYSFKEDNIKIYYVPTYIESGVIRKILYFIFSLMRIIIILITKNISIVHLHVSERGSFFRKYIVFKVAKLMGKRVIIHMHGAEFKEFYEKSKINIKKMILEFLKNADKVIVLGEKWNDYILSLDSNIKTVILYNSVKYAEEEVKYDGKNINILFMGVLIKRKGIYDLVDSVNCLQKDKLFNDYKIKFIIAGDGKERENFERYIKKLNLQKYFEFKGWIKGTEKEEIMKKSQIFILPSYNEGLPMAILEAMRYGMPIISTNVGSINDAVINGYNGYLVEPGNSLLMAEYIRKLIDNYEEWKMLSINSKKLIYSKYNDDNYFFNIKELYKNI